MYRIIDYENGKIEVQEHFHNPMVYLDHWALNDISLDDALREKFIQIMNRSGGTLRLSLVNIIELSKQSDKNQIDAILNMINSINDCGLINMNPEEVIKKENILISDPASIIDVKNPSAELDLITAYMLANNHPLHWHVSQIIRFTLDVVPSKALTESNQAFVNDMQTFLSVGRNNVTHLNMAKDRFEKLKNNGPLCQAATRELLQMALDFVMRNKTMKMSQYSEWNDLFHLVVPVSYCDIVLMDKRWKNFINQTGFTFPDIALTYDKRTLDDCFNRIEEWN